MPLEFTMANFTKVASKIKSSKLLMFYLGFSLLYCVVQTALSARAFIDTSGSENKIKALLAAGDALNATLPIVDDKSIALCGSSANQQNFTCNVVWDGEKKQNFVSGPLKARGGEFNDVPGAPRESVKLKFEGNTMDLDKSCLWSLNYVRSELGHSKRETIAFLCFQIWVFMISLIGIATDSMPHLLASLATHGLVLAWGIFQVIQSIGFQSTFKRVITDGACAGAQILPDLGSIRQHTDIPLLVVNFVAFLFSAFLTLRLIKLVNWHNFKNVGANLEMNRHRKFMLILFTVIQLSFFFVAVFCALLFDLVSNGNMKTMSSFPVFYKISCIVSLIVIVPWMLSGLYGVEREKKIPTMIFLTYAVFWVCGFATMFFSTSFRQEITRWSFFAVMGAMSVLITGAALILGIACRINFGKGYLIAKDIQADSPVDHRAKSWGDLESSPYSEKLAEMPSFASDVPQFPTTFEPPRMPPTAMNIPNRFFTPSSNSSSSSVSSGKPKSKGVALTDKGATKPSYRDSSASFGNMGGLGNSPPGYQAEFSTGNSFSTTGPSFSAPPRAAPAPPATAGLGTATSVGGQLGRMFTAGSTGTSMYTPGAEPSSSWSVFGHNVGNVPVSTIPSRSGTTTAATANPPTSSTLTPQRAWSSKE